MVGLICLEGLGHSYPESFMRKLAREWQFGPSEYVDNEDGLNIDRKASWAMYHTLGFAEKYPDLQGLIVAGYSQGGAAAIKYAHELKRYGWRLNGLALFDAVSREPYGNGVSFDPLIPDNVDWTVHGMRQFATMSRPSWGNCGRSSPNDYWSRTFWVTHGGASGCDYIAWQGSAPNPDDLVWERVYPTTQMKPTRVTQRDNCKGALELWKYMTSTIFTWADFLNRTGDPIWGEDATSAPKGNQPPSGAVPPSGGSKPPTGGPKSYVVVRGDSLSLIAGKFYKDVLLWPVIYDSNKSKIGGNPNMIQPNWTLTIPAIAGKNQSELNAIRQRGRNC